MASPRTAATLTESQAVAAATAAERTASMAISPSRNSERLQNRYEAAVAGGLVGHDRRRSPSLDPTGRRVTDAEEMSTADKKPKLLVSSTTAVKTIGKLVDYDDDEEDDFDVYSMPSSRLLTANEHKLCVANRLRPSQLLKLKTLLIKVSRIRIFKLITIANDAFTFFRRIYTHNAK